MPKKIICFILLFSIFSLSLSIDCSFKKSYPRQYIAYKLDQNITLDGKLDEPFWQETPWTQDFVDISTNITPRFRTNAKIRWDDNFLYIGAQVQENQIWANLTQDETVIFNDNDFEIFIDAGATTHYYKEYEMNARNKTWNLCLNKPYLNGGYENSTRVFGEKGWTMIPPLKTQTYIDGKINDPNANNKFWSVEVAMPITELLYNQTGGDSLRPGNKKFWRINFSRVEWKVAVVNGSYQKILNVSEDNWVWQPMGIIDIHLPELWGILQFTNSTSPSNHPVALEYYNEWPIRSLAMQFYNAEQAFFNLFQNYSASIKDLQVLTNSTINLECLEGLPEIKISQNGFNLKLQHQGKEVSINNDRYLVVKNLKDKKNIIKKQGNNKKKIVQ